MNNLYKISLLVLVSFFLSACTGKHLTVKSLQPSILPDKKINNIILEDFLNDDINQVNQLEEKLVNMVVDGKRVFNLQNSYENIDAIITGEVLNSSLYYDFYYDLDIDYSRCREYRYRDGKRTKRCIEYRERRIPCERRTYNVQTKVQILNKQEDIIFSKIYTKTKNIKQCFRDRYYYNPVIYNHFGLDRKETYYNSQLARSIANDIIKDISPHYVYQNIPIIEELEGDNVLYTENIKNEFKIIVSLLENRNIDVAQKRLIKLNMNVKNQSYEVLYNLALTYEAKDELLNAKTYYQKAQEICNNNDYLRLLDSSINRMQTHLESKIRAKSQLP